MDNSRYTDKHTVQQVLVEMHKERRKESIKKKKKRERRKRGKTYENTTTTNAFTRSNIQPRSESLFFTALPSPT